MYTGLGEGQECSCLATWIFHGSLRIARAIERSKGQQAQDPTVVGSMLSLLLKEFLFSYVYYMNSQA